MLEGLLIMYVKNAVILFVMFALFRALQVGFTEQALKISDVEKKIVFIAPLAYILIMLVFGGGFFASLMSLAAFVFIYAYFTGRL